jgi:hypothetical protein
MLRVAFAAWRWASGFPGYLNIDDFVRFVEYAEDRSSSEAQRFWFNVLDAGGLLLLLHLCLLIAGGGATLCWPDDSCLIGRWLVCQTGMLRHGTLHACHHVTGAHGMITCDSVHLIAACLHPW